MFQEAATERYPRKKVFLKSQNALRNWARLNYATTYHHPSPPPNCQSISAIPTTNQQKPKYNTLF